MKIQKPLFSILLLLASWLLLTKNAPADVLTADDGSYTIQAPYALQSSVTSVDTVTGPVTMHALSGTDGRTSQCSVGYGDYPPDPGWSNPGRQQAALEAIPNGEAKILNGTVVSDNAITYGNYPGRDITIYYTAGGIEGIARGHIFLVNNRLYAMWFQVMKSAEDDDAISSFFNSFSLKS
jgi:hypothetical protein